jgi:N-acyl homoserine lactone hydrolase
MMLQQVQSLKLRLDSGEIVLAADACYVCRTLHRRRLPRYRPDHGARLAALDRLEAPENFGAGICSDYDAEFWRSGAQVPATIA